LQTQFRSFLVRNSPKEAANLERKDAKFPWRPKLEAFTVLSKWIVANFGLLDHTG
jgi:hypothetical protein